jgi:lipopolysaccharide export system protein LptA
MLRTSLLVLLALAAGALSARAQGAPASGCNPKWNVVSDVVNTSDNQNHYLLLRNVQVECNDIQLFADEAEVFRDADRVRASGNVVFVSGTSRISAERMEFNTRTKTGTFYVATGIANIEDRGFERSLFGSQEPDAYFWGETIEKIGPKTYRITRGGFTTCVQPTPRWEMVAGTVTLTLEKRAVMTNMLLKVKDVPVFYLPAMYYPINKEDRATGFLIPIYGQSDIKGQTLSNRFFWAINRSQDATLYHSYYSKTGQSFGAEYRYVQSGASSGNVQTSIVREHDSTTYVESDGTETVVPGIDSFTVTGTVLQQLPANLRLTGNANYFSSLVAQQRYQQEIYRATNRTRNFGINVAGNWGANSLSGTVDRNETFTNDTESTVSGSAPRLNYSRSEKRIGGVPLYFGATSEYVDLVRTGRTPAGEIPLGLKRIDIVPTLRFPFTRLQYLTFNSSIRYHETFWSESYAPRESAAGCAPPLLRSHLVDHRPGVHQDLQHTGERLRPEVQARHRTELDHLAQDQLRQRSADHPARGHGLRGRRAHRLHLRDQQPVLREEGERAGDSQREPPADVLHRRERGDGGLQLPEHARSAAAQQLLSPLAPGTGVADEHYRRNDADGVRHAHELDSDNQRQRRRRRRLGADQRGLERQQVDPAADHRQGDHGLALSQPHGRHSQAGQRPRRQLFVQLRRAEQGLPEPERCRALQYPVLRHRARVSAIQLRHAAEHDRGGQGSPLQPVVHAGGHRHVLGSLWRVRRATGTLMNTISSGARERAGESEGRSPVENR